MKIKEVLWPIIIALLLALIVIVLSQEGFFWRVEAELGDALQGGYTPSEQIVIVGIDERSISEIGRYPWDRSVYADALSILADAQAKLVALDIGLFEPTEEDYVFAQGINKLDYQGIPVIISEEVIYDDLRSESALLVPTWQLRNRTLQGYSNLMMDPDGVVRRLPLHLLKDHQPFSVMIAEQYGRVVLPMSKEVLILFAGGPGTFNRVSFVDLVKGNVDPALLKDKIVLIGAVAPDLHDDYLTPLSYGEAMPGVEVHANAVQMILARAYINQPSQETANWIILLFAFLGTLLFVITHVIVRRPLTALLGIVVPVVYLVIVINKFDQGLLLPVVPPIVAFVLTYLLLLARWVSTEQTEKGYLKQAFEKYVSPVVIKEMMKNPKDLSIGGERRELTILFSDIRGFTSLSEEMDPEKLVAFLNEYLTKMTDLIIQRDGLIDKFIGDAIMALWNAPLDQDGHACLACESAVAMITTLEEMQRAEGGRFKDLRIGIGIHSGEAVVGNMGSDKRFDYTAIGDNVNLASRLEGLTKMYRVDIIISEETRKQIKQCAQEFTVRRLDKVRVKGKKHPITIYELLTKPNKGIPVFESGLDDYFSGRFASAKKKFAAVGDGPSKVFLKRINILTKRKKPKHGKWDGVWTHESK